jgi:hypothetical protein
MDEQVDAMLPTREELLTVAGVFRMKLHFPSSRATLRPVDDAFRFRIHGIDDLANPDPCLARPLESTRRRQRFRRAKSAQSTGILADCAVRTRQPVCAPRCSTSSMAWLA